METEKGNNIILLLELKLLSKETLEGMLEDLKGNAEYMDEVRSIREQLKANAA